MEKIREIDNYFVSELKLDWFGFDHIDMIDDYPSYYVREMESKIDVIHYNYSGRGLVRGEDFSPFTNRHHFRSNVEFFSVSKILREILVSIKIDVPDNFLFWGETSRTIVNFRNFDKMEKGLTPNETGLALYNSKGICFDNIKKLSEDIAQYLITYHFPFFERVSSLQVVNDEIIDKVPKEDYSNYIPGKYMNAKVLIIMKLCNNPRYEEYRDWAIGAYKKGVEINPDRYLEDFNLIQSLVNYLDSGKYKELL